MRKNYFLVLETGEVYPGSGFGKAAPTASELAGTPERLRSVGELVFNTGMAGYPEILTDPSYTGQIVSMTYPHIGNYGVDPEWSETGPGVDHAAVQPAGFVVRSLYEGPVPKKRMSLDDYLADNGVPGITGVDTRALTLRIRTGGSPRAAIIQCEHSADPEPGSEEIAATVTYLRGFPAMEGRGLVHIVGCNERQNIEGGTGYRITLVDTGIKANIVRSLQSRGCVVSVVPSTTTAAEILSDEPDGVLYSNGPGDPAVLPEIAAEIERLIGKVPLFGICLGHQLISIALGAKTYKMKFGHHGCNHPVRDEFNGRVFVTSQNHGFVVDDEALPADLEVWLRNANDQTIEGIAHKKLAIRTVQFHPEAAPGPLDTNPIFDDFLATISNT